MVIPANTGSRREVSAGRADDDPNKTTSAPDGALHAAFKLSNSGESLALFFAPGVLQHG
jgi:hypothetical protein